MAARIETEHFGGPPRWAAWLLATLSVCMSLTPFIVTAVLVSR